MTESRAKPTLRRRALRTLGLIGLGYLGIVGFMMVRETALVFPGAENRATWGNVPVAASDFPWDSLRVLAADGVPVFLVESRLDDWEVRPWAIYLHGNGTRVGEPGSVERMRMMREAGFNVIGVEYRGYGASSSHGPPSEDGVYADAEAALARITGDLGVPSERVVAYGWSLGSGVATRLAAEASLAGVITEGAFTSLPELAASFYPWLPVRLVARNRFDNLGRAPRIDRPWLVLHGRADELVPIEHATRLADAAPDARMVALDAGHDDGVGADPEVARAALQNFVARVFP